MTNCIALSDDFGTDGGAVEPWGSSGGTRFTPGTGDYWFLENRRDAGADLRVCPESLSIFVSLTAKE